MLLITPDLTPTLPPPPRPPVAQRRPRKRLAVLLVSALAGGALGYFATTSALELLLPLPPGGGRKVLALVPLLALPLVWLLAVAIHEGGHVLGGWMGGGTFLLWLVGPVMVRRTPGGIRVAWNRNVNVAGGIALCLPLAPREPTPARVAWMIVCGPLASLALAAAAYTLGRWLGADVAHPTASRALTQNVAMFTALMSLAIFVLTAFPGSAGGFKTDGKRVVELLRGGRHSEQEAALIALSAAGLAGLRPREYNPALVRQAVALEDGSLFDLYGHFTIYYTAADRGDWTAAQAHLDRVLAGEEKVAPYIRDAVRCEYAWMLATRGLDVGIARAWLESAGKLDFDPATRLRAEAAVLLAEGRAEEAAARAREGLHALEHRSLSPVKSLFAAEALEAVISAAAGKG